MNGGEKKEQIAIQCQFAKSTAKEQEV